MIAWLIQLARLLWLYLKPQTRAHAELLAEPEDEEALWFVWLCEEGQPEALVGCIAGTHVDAVEAAEIAAGMRVMAAPDEDYVYLGVNRIKEISVHTEDLLKTALSAAVPLWIGQLKLAPWSELQERAAVAAQIVAEKGDVLMFKSKKKGETARAFNALAEGVAIMSFSPGGVTLFGLHFEAKHEGVA